MVAQSAEGGRQPIAGLLFLTCRKKVAAARLLPKE